RIGISHNPASGEEGGAFVPKEPGADATGKLSIPSEIQPTEGSSIPPPIHRFHLPYAGKGTLLWIASQCRSRMETFHYGQQCGVRMGGALHRGKQVLNIPHLVQDWFLWDLDRRAPFPQRFHDHVDHDSMLLP